MSRTEICELDKAAAPAEAGKESSVRSDVIGESEKEVSRGPLLVRDDGEAQAAETLLQDQNHQDEEFGTAVRIVESEVLADSLEVGKGREEGADAASQSVGSELDPQVSINLIPEDRDSVPDNLATETNLREKEGNDVAAHLSPEHTLNEQTTGKDSSEVNGLMERVDVVPEPCSHDFVAEAGLHSEIGGSVDAEANFAMENCIMPSNHGDMSGGTALGAPEEHDSLMLVEGSEDAERVEKSSANALSEADFQNSSFLKDDFGHSVEHGDTNYAPVIDDEGACLDVGGWDMKATDGHDVCYSTFPFLPSPFELSSSWNSFLKQSNLNSKEVLFMFLLG